MPVPNSISDLTNIPATNSPAGTESVKGTIDDFLRAHGAFIRQIYDQTLGPTVNLQAAGTMNIGFAAALNIYVVGGTTITAFDSYAEGTLRWLIFGGTSVLVHNGGSLVLPGLANIITTPGDSALFKSLGNGNWQCLSYNRIALRFPAAGTVLSDATAVAITQGGTGANTGPAALASLGALPLAGGQMTGNLLMGNNTGLFFKDSAGNLRQTFVFAPDDNIYLSLGSGGFFRVQNAQGTATVLQVDNSGNVSPTGGVILPNNTPLYMRDASGTLRAVSYIDPSNWMNYFGAQAGTRWLNAAGNSTIATLSDGGVFSANTVTQTSDERKKRGWQHLPKDFIAQLAAIKKSGLFTWRKGGGAGLGVGAQSLERILPVAVHTDANGAKTVNYGAAAMVSVVELARAMVAQEKRLAALEAK